MARSASFSTAQSTGMSRKIGAVLPEREIIHSVYGVGYKYEW
jgi:hypothetical protein